VRSFVVGDIHGRFDALENVLSQANFDDNKDSLITIGDICDGAEQTKECVERLISIKNIIPILGNHDWWFLQWLEGKHPGRIWTDQGGRATLRSYDYKTGDGFFQPSKIPKNHINFFKKMLPWFETETAIFVHGGISWKGHEYTDNDTKMWDRNFITKEYNHFYMTGKNYWQGKTVFLGHTATRRLHIGECVKDTEKSKPVIMPNVVALDTGAGNGGKLTLMEIHDKEYIQSNVPFIKIKN